jgi:hypothetical protein
VRSPLTKGHNCRPLVAVLLLLLVGCDSESDPVLQETFERLYAIQPTADITIQNHDGAILIYGWNMNEMRLQATKKAYSPSRLKQIAIDVSVQPTSVSINVKRPPKPKWALFDRSGTVDCTIVVPATANISQLRLDTGEVFVDGMHGRSVHAWLGDGRMFVRNCFTDTNLALQRGNLALSYDWWAPGTFSVQADIVRGNAWAFLPRDAACHLVAETGYGHLGNDFDSPAVARPAFAEAAKIDMLIHVGGHAAIKLRTANGDIKVMATNP